MSFKIEGIKRAVTEAPFNIKNAVLGPREELIKPSPFSTYIRERTKIPNREMVADLVETVRLSALGPINLARLFHEQMNVHPVVATFGATGLPLGIGLMSRLAGGDANVGLSVAVATYLVEGYYLNHQQQIDSTVDRAVKRVFGRSQGMHSII